ncbi:hypothetical protein L3Q65_25700 [Amycolatopsis sp. FU40]|uniref:hypothetical protein n=1 Tax=Amycolatopsis sp. FU40 TaxID=2914159 RepID=UPI001F34CEBA|nr:hypothetical protein [Amycolatopsis sp. FU40]UKD51325.1 hypothetical protein L3Q65_25700 [Amycolatopsis sp. FU40]
MFVPGGSGDRGDESIIRAVEFGDSREVGDFRHGSEAGIDGGVSELTAMAECYQALRELPDDRKVRSILWLIQAWRLGDLVQCRLGVSSDSGAESGSAVQFAEEDLGPRVFMGSKKPQSQAERIACLAYYLTYFRGIQHFKAKDIETLNTEAAGQKIGNLSRDIDNADRHSGYIVSAGTGMKQLTMRGEAVVKALPARDGVKRALAENPYRARRNLAGGRKGPVGVEGEQ